MRAERAGGAGRGRALAAAAALGLLLTGCASMPDSGPVQQANSSQRAEGESQVRVFGVSPPEDALPQEIVRGFLEAVTSDEAEFDTAREYLTPERRAEWDPFAGVTVLASGPEFSPLQNGNEPPLESPEGFRMDLSGVQLAELDGSSTYVPTGGVYRETFELVRVEGQWRIDELPDGLVMREADFRRIYRSVDAFYYADLGAEAVRATGHDVLVADPIFVRRRIDPVGEIVDALLGGPSPWLRPVVRTAFPYDAQQVGARPEIDESGALSIRLSGAAGGDAEECERMAAQLLHTVREVASVEVTEARIATVADTELCSLSWSEAESWAPGRLDGELEKPYFLDEERQLVSVSDDEASAVQRVTGPLGSGERAFRSAAVSRDEVLAAGVDADGGALYVAPLAGADTLGEPVAVSESAGEDAGFSAPSWDGLGDLWVADRDPERPRLLRLSGGRGAVTEIPVEGLPSGHRVDSLRVASDGVRVAMLVTGDGQTTLQLGRVERAAAEEPGGEIRVSVAEPRPMAPQLEQVAAASWAGGSRLMVVGRPEDGVEQLHYVTTDGSFASMPTLPGLNNVSGIAAAEDENKPLLAETANGIARLQQDAQWKLVDGGGTGPFYPG